MPGRLLNLGGDTPCGWHKFSTGRAISPVSLNKPTSGHAKVLQILNMENPWGNGKLHLAKKSLVAFEEPVHVSRVLSCYHRGKTVLLLRQIYTWSPLHFIPKRCKRQGPQTLQKPVHVEDVFVLSWRTTEPEKKRWKEASPYSGTSVFSCFIFLGTPSLLCCLSLTEQEKVVPKRFLASSTGFTTQHFS